MSFGKNTKIIGLCMLLWCTAATIKAQKPTNIINNNKALTKATDTVPKGNRNTTVISNEKPANNIQKKDSSNRLTGDTTVPIVDTFNIAFSKDSLDAPIQREAIDSAVFLAKDKLFLLYGQARTTYNDNNIDADFIKLDQKKEILFARGLLDSTGQIEEQLTLKTTDQNVTADSITYSTKTGKAVTHNSRTTNDEMFIQTQKAKLLGDKKSFFGYDNKFTTCNYDEPHFCFHAKRVKVVANEIAVSGFANPEFEGVPMPIGIPFGIFPMKKGRRGGLLPPQFTANEDLGLGLEGLGYYFTFNKKNPEKDYWDLTLRSNIYSYGSWNAIITPTYRKRYKYNGSFNLNIQNTRFNFKGDADFTKNRSFNLGWSHSADTRARPGVTFSANVNAGKSSFNGLNPNNPFRNTQNQMNSSITWGKTWQQKLFGQDNTFNLTTSANHSQNTLNNSVNLNLPDIAFTIQTFFPFAKPNSVGTPKWYEKIGMAYNGNLRSQMAFFDNEPIKEIIRTLKDTFQWGAQHNIPITLSLPSLGPIQIAPSISYEERTYGQKIFQRWNNSTKRVDTTINKGVFQARQMSFGFSLATALFGTYQFNKPRLVAMRHVIRPNIGIAYTPNMNKRYNYELQIDSFGYKRPVSVFDGNLYGAFASQRFGGISFGIDQNLELKTRKKGDTVEAEYKKVRIIDGFSINSGYNFLAPTFKLSPINFSLRSTLADGKLNVTANAILNPYWTNRQGQNVNRYAWFGRKFGWQSFGRITTASLALSTQFSGGNKTGDASSNRNTNNFRGNTNTEDMTMDEQMRLNDYITKNPAEFVDFNIPWDLTLNGAINFTNQIQSDYTYKGVFNASVNFNGNFSLTSKWKCGATGFYDFRVGKIQQVQMFITREMHCWQLAINVTPVGAFRSFNITLNPKAGILRDLRINRTRYFYGE